MAGDVPVESHCEVDCNSIDEDHFQCLCILYLLSRRFHRILILVLCHAGPYLEICERWPCKARWL